MLLDQASWAKVVARAWTDPTFEERLLRDPDAALRELDIPIPSGVQQINVLREAAGELIIPLPVKPAHMSEEEWESRLRQPVIANFTY